MPKYGLAVERQDAEKVHVFLLENSLLEKSLKPVKGEKIVFPVKKMSAANLSRLRGISKTVKKVPADFEQRGQRPRGLKSALSGKLSKKELGLVQRSYDTLGEVAIIEIPPELGGKEKLIGKVLMDSKGAVKSVYLKTGAHKGVFRQEPVEYLCGEKRKYAYYKEHGCTFRISLGKVFFSPRLGTERKRIASQIKQGEIVAALFAGVGPFPIVFAKKSGMEKAVAIELNPAAFHDMQENIRLNRVSAKVEPVLGDVKKLAKRYAGKFDRAVMPLPKSSGDFLEDAIAYIKPEGGTVHFYQFTSRENPYKGPLERVKEACARLKKKFRVLSKRRVRQYAPGIIQVVIDFKVFS